MDYANRHCNLLSVSTLALALASIGLAGCDKGSLGEFETETETDGGSESQGSDTEGSTSGTSGTSGNGSESMSTSASSETTTSATSGTTEGTGTSTSGNPTDTSATTTTGPGTCEVDELFSCAMGVDCDEEFNCGALESPFDESGCLRLECERHAGCGDEEFCYHADDHGSCASSNVFCDEDENGCSCGSSDDCGGSYCVPADVFLGGNVVQGPTIGWADNSCAPDDGAAVEFQLGLVDNACGAENDGGLLVSIFVYSGGPLSESHQLAGDAFGFVQVSDDGGATALGTSTGVVRIFSWGDTVDGEYEVTVEGGDTYVGAFNVPFCMGDPLCG